MNKDRIKYRVLAALIFTFTALLATSLFTHISLQNKSVHDRILEKTDSAKNIYYKKILNEGTLLQHELGHIIHDRTITQALLQKNRRALVEPMNSYFQEWRLEHEISQLSLFDSEGVSYFDSRESYNFDPNHDDDGTLPFQQHDKAVYGIHLTPDGELMIKVIAPLYHENNYIGQISTSKKSDTLFNNIDDILGCRTFVLVDHKLKSKIHTLEFSSTNQPQLVDSMIPLPSTLQNHMVNLRGTFIRSFTKCILGHKECYHRTSNDDSIYYSGHFPLTDIEGNLIGQVVTIIDVTTDLNNARSATFLFVGIFILVAGVLIALLFSYLGWVEKQLSATRRTALRESAAREAEHLMHLNESKCEREALEKSEADLKKRVKELADAREAALNMMEDADEARETATLAEKALKVSEARIRSILENAADGIITINEQGIIETFNVAAHNLFGYTADEIVGRNVSVLMPDPYSSEHDQYLKSYLHTGTQKIIGQRRELTGLRKNGSTFPIELHVSKVELQDRCIFTGMITDITDRKIIEEDHKQYAHALEQANKSLEDANEATEAAAKTKSEFLANMSHEIRTPMAAILGYAEQLNDQQLPEAERQTMVQTIMRNGQHLLDIINNVLDLSKIEAGKMEIEQIEFSPSQIVHDVVSLMRVRTSEKNLSLQARFLNKIPATIQSDPTRLRQILINLVGNAIKFTRAGSIDIETSLIKNKDGEFAMLFDIIDTGIGMTQEYASKLFSPFTQEDSSHTRNYGGTGLGLTISRKFAVMLEGVVTLKKTQLGVGSQFRVIIKTGNLDHVELMAPEVISTVVDTSSQKIESGKIESPKIPYQILLVEDSLDNQKLISRILEKQGASVTFAENGKIGVECASQAWENGTPFDVILMDIQMPVMDGYEATSLLRQKGYNSPIVALTAHAMSGDREKCLRAGCDDYATKPISREKLIKLITDLVEKKSTATVTN